MKQMLAFKLTALKSGLFTWLIGLCMVAAWGGCDSVLAHKVTVFAWVDGDSVHVESKFSGGRRPSRAAVVVYDLAGKPLLEGTTDLQGRFTFKAPSTNGLKVTVGAGMGHRGEWLLPAEEFSHLEEMPADSDTHPESSSATKPPMPETLSDNPDLHSERSGCLSAEEVEAIVQRIIDRKLQPVLYKLNAQQDQPPSAQDIFGGLGYIMGLVGLLAYWRSHKQP
jgi:nickel transport protein